MPGNRFHQRKRRAHCWLPARTTFWLILGLSIAGQASSLFADDSTRRVQEELRKRNLYFGDVDGRRTPPFVAALRRYQERKGFTTSGEADEQTLRSLDLPPSLAVAAFSPPAAAATIANPNPAGNINSPSSAVPLQEGPAGPESWPDVPVLRSDEGRRNKPSSTVTAAALDRIMPGSADPISPPARFNTPPESSFDPGQAPSPADIKDFITRYLRAGQTNDPSGELPFYGERVNYFNQGMVDKSFIAQDIRRYEARWPHRDFTLLGAINVVADANNLDHTLVRFRYRFTNRNSAHACSGEMESIYTLVGGTPATLRIIQLRERLIRKGLSTPGALSATR